MMNQAASSFCSKLKRLRNASPLIFHTLHPQAIRITLVEVTPHMNQGCPCPVTGLNGDHFLSVLVDLPGPWAMKQGAKNNPDY